MKTLIVFYSRTGTTKKVGEILAQKIGSDTEIEEIKDTVDRSGAIGFMKSGKDALRRNLTTLEPLGKNPENFDLVVIGTPVWASNVSTPVRTYLEQMKGKMSQVAFFCTVGGVGMEKAFAEMEKIVGRQPVATFFLRTVEVMKQDVSGKIDEFVKKISSD